MTRELERGSMTLQPVDLTIMDSERTPVRTQLNVDSIAVGKRLGRGLLRLVACWALAVACIFVPLLHFVLVPGFVLLGPVLAWKASTATVSVSSTEITCPRCSTLTPVEPGTTGWPARLWCASCGTTFFARRVPS